MSTQRILVIGGEGLINAVVEEFSRDWQVDSAARKERAGALLRQRDYDLVVIELDPAHTGPGLEILDAVHECRTHPRIVLVTLRKAPAMPITDIIRLVGLMAEA